MRPERMPELLAELRYIVGRYKSKFVAVRNNVTTEFPNVLPTTPYRGFSVAEILTPPRSLSQGEASALYEQVVWWKVKGLDDADSLREVKANAIASLGAPLFRMIDKERSPDRAVLLLTWGIGASISMPLTLDSSNGYIKVGDKVFGFVNRKLVSSYVKDHESKLDMQFQLTSPIRTQIRASQAFAVLNAASIRDKEDNVLLKIITLALGVPAINRAYGVQGALHNLKEKERQRLHRKCSEAVEDTTINPLPMLKSYLVPRVLDSVMFHTLFGPMRFSRLPGKIKRTQLQKALNNLFT